MSAGAQQDDGRTIDRHCDEFEAEWQAGRLPAIEAFLERVAVPLRSRLLGELLALEVEFRLRRGEKVLLADYEQRFSQDAAVVAAALAKTVALVGPGAPDSSQATLTLKVIEGPSQGQSFIFAGAHTLLVGRSKKATLFIQDHLLSRFHLRLDINPPVGRLSDLQSCNGTWVNDQSVQTAELRDGDTIRLGQTVMHVLAAVPSARSLDEDLEATQVAPVPLSGGEGAAAPDCSNPVSKNPPGPTVSQPSELPVILGYRIERELGRGGMGVVYQAHRDKDGLQVALKTIKRAATAQPRQVKRFLREANILCQLKHHHIVTFLEANEFEGLLYFAMEYIEGTDAAQLLRQQERFPVREGVRMVCQLLSALKYAHAQRFVHRDIKPANMLIASERGKKSIKLADFGLARVYQESQLSGVTLLDEVGGTMAFMPPEQVTHFRQVGPAADQYSAAATLYNLLTGKYLYEFNNREVRAITLVLHEKPVPLRQRRPELPEQLAAIVHRALAKEPSNRFTNVADFRSALLPFAK